MTTPHLSRFVANPRDFGDREERYSSSSPFHTLARVLFVATLFGAPWAFGAVEPWAWAALMVSALLTLLLWGAGCAQQGILKINPSALYWPFVGFLILAACQLFTGMTTDHVATREAVLKILTDLIIFFLAGQLISADAGTGRVLERFGLVATLLALSLCLLALAQLYWNPAPKLIYWNFSTPGAPFGPYVNQNDYAGLMEMLLPISVAYILSLRSRSLQSLLLWGAVILILVSVWMSGSRGGTIVLLVEGALWTYILTGYLPRGVSPRSVLAWVAAILIAAGTFYWLTSRGRVYDRAWTVLESHESLHATLGDRLRIGLDTIHIVRAHPWFGIGVGCFEYVIPSYLTFASDLRWNHAHDDVLESAAEMGLPGILLILAAIWLFFRTAFGQMKRRLRYGWGWIQIGAAVGAVGLFVHSFVDFNLRIPANAAWFVVCLAIATHARPVLEQRPVAVWTPPHDRGF